MPALPSPFRIARSLTWSAAAFLLFAGVASTIAISPSSATFGAYPGFDSTDLYSLVFYVLIGGAAARFLRSRRNMERTMWSLAIADGLASIYGVAQFAGLDPLHFDLSQVNNARTPLTFGDPSFAGSLLTISLMASACSSSSTILQTIALGAAASRGAWVGTGIGALVFAMIVLWSYRRSGSPNTLATCCDARTAARADADYRVGV